MIKHRATRFDPELPGSRHTTLLPSSSSKRRAPRLLHHIEFFAAGSASELLGDEDAGHACHWSLAVSDAQPRDPRVRALIEAAARGWVSDRARSDA